MVKVMYKVYTLSINYGDFINSIKLLDQEDTNFEKEYSINNDINWFYYKYIEETTYGEYLENRGIDINDLKDSMSENIKKVDPSITEELILKIVSATFERKIRKTYDLNIFYTNNKAYFITHSTIAITKFSEITNIVLTRIEVDDFPDLLLWITKKGYYNEMINNLKIVDITNLSTIEDRGNIKDSHSSDGYNLMESDSVLYRLTRSQQITILEIYINISTVDLAFKFSLYSDYPDNSKTFNVIVNLIRMWLPDDINGYIKSIDNKTIITQFKRSYLIFIVASLFLNEAVGLYNNEKNQWKTDKKKYLRDIKDKVKKILK